MSSPQTFTADTVYRDFAGAHNLAIDESTGFAVVDVTDKTATRTVATLTYPQVGFTHQGWLTEDHRFFLLGDELD